MKLKYLVQSIFFELLILACFPLVAYSKLSVSPHPVDSLKAPDKIYITLDKPFYAVEETIYYKVYQVNAQSNLLHSLNEVVFVELLNEKNKVIFLNKVKVKEGVAMGEIYLPDTLQGGTYRVVGFSRWSKNFPTSFIFSRRIEIVNYFQTKTHSSATISFHPEENQSVQAIETEISKTSKIDIQFFPEGGFMVENLTSKVGFKAMSESGKGITVKGHIVDSNGKELTAFTSNSLGMGTFSIKPVPSTAYKALIVVQDTIKKELLLPEALKNGVVMTVDNLDSDSIEVNINPNLELAKPDTAINLFEVSARGKIYYSKMIDLSTNQKLFISKNSLPEGVVAVTLNAEGKRMSERLIFNEVKAPIAINATSGKQEFVPREKVQIEFDLRDNNGNPASGSFSVKALDGKQIIRNKNEDNIFTNLLLTSEIKGVIEDPYYYFSSKSSKITEDLDILLLTQGWRRYVWNEVNISEPLTFQRGKGANLSGLVVDQSGKPSAYASIIVALPGSSFPFFYTSTDKDGKFLLPTGDAPLSPHPLPVLGGCNRYLSTSQVNDIYLLPFVAR